MNTMKIKFLDSLKNVIPAQAGIQMVLYTSKLSQRRGWIPAFAGTTMRNLFRI
jgi:hypothetical protein